MGKPVGVFDGDASARHLLRAALESDAQVVVLLQSASKIDRQGGVRGDAFQRAIVHDVSRFRTVQIDHMQMAQPVVFKLFGHLQRIFVVDLLRGVISLGKAYALALDHVYGRN